ncbi:MAG: IS1634 family transposase [Planctomycetota bacterium]|nr:IS1634 family transposase [Planctomycetota bacterium]
MAIIVVMYIESVPNRNSPPCILLRESYRHGGKVRKRTLANLTQWPPEVVVGLRALIKGGKVSADGDSDGFEIERSLPHGHVAAVLGVLRSIGLHKIIAPRRCRQRDMVMAMIVARIIDPRSKLATARGLSDETAFTSLGEAFGLGPGRAPGRIDENDLYAAMDWLLARQRRIEAALAGRHLHDGTLVLYDLSSSYFEGKTCPLAKLGYSRDGKKGTLQIVYGLLCDVEGRPIAIEVFDGNTGDPATLATQVAKLRKQFGLTRVVLVGDRGMITEARIREDLDGIEGFNWITALRGGAIRGLVKAEHLEPSLFDQTDMAEITSPDYPGQRLIVCRNPLLVEKRRHTRQELLEATEQKLAKIVTAVTRTNKPLRGADKIGLRVGRVINHYKVAKHFAVHIGDDSLAYERKVDKIAEEAALDGFYVIRTDVPEAALGAEQTVRAYKGLSKVERAFRRMKTVDLQIRPIHHRTADRVRAHVLLCMLAYYVEWHIRELLAPVLFDDEDPSAGRALQTSPVSPGRRSPGAKRKAATKRTDTDMPVHSFQTVLADLATITKNRIQPSVPGAESFEKITRPTSNQQRILDLLNVSI